MFAFVQVHDAKVFFKVSSLRLLVDEERKEIDELRLQQKVQTKEKLMKSETFSQFLTVSLQELLASSDGETRDSIGLMYGNLLRNYDVVKEDYNLIRRRFDELHGAHGAAMAKLEHTQVGSWKGCSVLLSSSVMNVARVPGHSEAKRKSLSGLINYAIVVAFCHVHCTVVTLDSYGLSS